MLSRFRRWWQSRGDAERRSFESDLPETLLTAMDALIDRFAAKGIDHALIGGVALALHGLPRATRDLDLIVDRGSADEADAVMLEIGFERLARGKVFGNYLLGPLRVDLLFTMGTHSQRMLERAKVISIRRGSSKLVGPEDLIGLKLQAQANEPNRPYDRGDIEMLVRRFSGTMDLTLLRDYFRLFAREDELDALLEAVRTGNPRDPGGGSGSGIPPHG